MINNSLRQFLKDYNCDTKLFDYILNCKENLAKRKNSYVCPVFIETSVKKNFKTNKESKGRYIIFIILEEFNNYTLVEKENIFKLVNFKFSEFEKLIKNMDKISDIIFGYDGNKGKVYLNETYTKKRLYCYENGGKIKYYKEVYPNVKYVYDTKDLNTILKTDIRIRDKNNKFVWHSHYQDEMTTYYRPFININNFEKLNEKDKLDFILTNDLYLHSSKVWMYFVNDYFNPYNKTITLIEYQTGNLF